MLTIRVAGLAVGIDTADRRLEAACGPYLCRETPRFTITLTDAERAAEAASSPEAPEWEIESMAIYRKLCLRALEDDCILFHCSALEVDGRGYLFAGPSGTGKSTHARLWRELLGARALPVNDDKPLLRLMEGSWFVCGTPWNGKHGLGRCVQVPIQGICFLEQSGRNEISPAESGEAIPRLLNQMLRPQEVEKMDRLLRLTENLIRQVPLWRLRCLPNREAAALCYETMRGMVTDNEDQRGL